MSTRLCTRFCSNDCDGEHHPMLAGLVKIRNEESMFEFLQLLKAYQVLDFRFDLSVPDPHPDFRYPILHWAAVLGKSDIVKVLLKPPYSVNPTLKSSNGETALHRLLNVMDDGRKAKLSLLLKMVNLLRACLPCVDNEKKTPLHHCADILASCTKKELDVWKRVFHSMLDIIMKSNKDILNYQDDSGDNILHILSKREDLLHLVEYVIKLGGDLSAPNKAVETPIEVSWRFSMPTYNYYQMLKFGVIEESNSSIEESEYSDNNLSVLGSGSSEMRTTRASLSLSETKDYTQFFEENMVSDDSCDGVNGHDSSFKRKISEMNSSLTNRLEELSATSCYITAQTKGQTHHTGRPLKRCRIISDTSESENDKLDFNTDRQQKQYRKKRTKKAKISEECKLDTSVNSDENPSDNGAIPSQQAKDDKCTTIREELQAIGVEVEPPTKEQGELKLNADQIRDRITDAIQGIKELFEDESSEDDNEDDDESESEDNEEIKQMKNKEKLLDRKIDILKHAINKLTSL